MWRNTARPVMVVFLDARACFPVLAFFMYWSWTTAKIAIFGTLFFGMISWLGLTLPSFVRLLRRWINGSLRPAIPAWKRRRFA
ncbi:IcmT/TraK family protein [Beijerinckia indica]|uniref:IcmT n=1 Tax=Beijerinckia indica subsp. indica (strain ATCC 9039 / DSM 1715 / NCIMB 8712) TaxID=395963 RepID=B2IL32_BEII9|nr:IcmT/TraK family protein [Beijerinckia indica]ACB97232.1 IcmT [Beijerinckia indica subsp. indica ATCC 9039]